MPMVKSAVRGVGDRVSCNIEELESRIHAKLAKLDGAGSSASEVTSASRLSGVRAGGRSDGSLWVPTRVEVKGFCAYMKLEQQWL